MVEDSAGISIVRNQGADRPADWRLVRAFSIAPRDTAAGLPPRLTPDLATADGRGTSYVATSDRLLRFDSLGRSLPPFGRRGSGPGEFQYGYFVLVEPSGRPGVADFGKRAVVSFERDGSPVPELSFTGLGSPEYAPRRVGDTLLVITLDRQAERFELRTGTASATSTLLAIDNPLSEPNDWGCVKMPPEGRLFASTIAADWNGHYIAVASRPEYEISLFTDRRVTRLIRRNLPPLATTAALIRRRYPAGDSITFGGGGRPPCIRSAEALMAKRGWASFIQPIAGMRFAPDGWLWVDRTRFPDEPHRVDIFDDTGRYRGSLPTPGPLLGFATSALVLFAVPDSLDGGDRLEGYRLVR
ncbi:MAG: hypothetical protein ACKVZ0_03695 [Gemmatimonadales bacterium]